MTIDAAARLIAEARTTGVPFERLPEDLRPKTEAEGFEIQKAVADRLGLEVAAWKVSAAGPSGGSAAPIFAGTVHMAPYVAKTLNTLETEIALRLVADLPGRPDRPYTRQEILAAVDCYAMAFEMVDWRVTSPDLTFQERIADCFANEGLIIGKQVPFQTDFSSPVDDVRLFCDGAAETFTPVDIDPIESIRAYVSVGGDLFDGLKAGQWVLTGSMTGLQKVTAPARWNARWRDITDVSVEVTG